MSLPLVSRSFTKLLLFFIYLLPVYLSQSSFVLSAVLAEEASKIASTFSDVFTATVLDVEKCKELKMGSYLGVAAASANPPHFIHLCYKPTDGNVKRKLAIVGKGLTFDRFVVLATYLVGL